VQAGFSKVLFALKENNKNLGIKIKEVTQFDSTYNIGYFLQPDSFLELDEVSDTEIKFLLDEIKTSGLYDFIVIDLSSNLNYKNITLMEESDEIIVVITPELIAINKLDNFLKDILLQGEKRGTDFLKKIVLILNQWEESNHNSQKFNMLSNNLSKIGKRNSTGYKK
jgi:MinD-like ATPase involved in chromosome partitioning or flagellar assembly